MLLATSSGKCLCVARFCKAGCVVWDGGAACCCCWRHRECASEAWRNKFADLSKTKKLAVVDFTAAWCPPCKMIAPFFNELSKSYESVVFLKVDVDALQDVAAEWKIEGMPTFVFVVGGKEVHRIVGANKAELESNLLTLSKESSDGV